MHSGFTRRGPDWRAWIACLAILLIGATSASTIWHGEHGADQDCTVCHLRHQPAANLSAAPQIGPAGTPEPLKRFFAVEWVGSDHGSSVPARAPPA